MPSPGEIWLAKISFTDASASKIRPVLILWLDAADCVVAAVTSASPRSPSDISLENWQAAGLRVPSTVRLSRLDCLEQVLLAKNWAGSHQLMPWELNKFGLNRFN